VDGQKRNDGLCYCGLRKTLQAHMIRAISALVLCIAVWLIGCAASQPIAPSPIGKALLGKSKQELVAALVTLFRK